MVWMNAEYELGAKRIERNVLEVELEDEELWEYEKYQRLKRQIADLKEKVEDEPSEPEEDRSEGIVFEAGD